MCHWLSISLACTSLHQPPLNMCHIHLEHSQNSHMAWLRHLVPRPPQGSDLDTRRAVSHKYFDPVSPYELYTSLGLEHYSMFVVLLPTSLTSLA
jgi:hypothetical protein